MTRFIYNTATTLNGFIADEANSLDWLFVVEQPGGEHETFMENIGVIVQGSTTYEWVLREEHLLDDSGKWPEYFGERPTFVFTSRDLPIPRGADVRLVSGAVADYADAFLALAGDKDVWVVGGGDLAGQFLDAGLLDEIQVSVAPVTLAGGAPLFPRRVGSERLRLRTVEQRGQFAHLTLDVTKGEAV